MPGDSLQMYYWIRISQKITFIGIRHQFKIYLEEAVSLSLITTNSIIFQNILLLDKSHLSSLAFHEWVNFIIIVVPTTPKCFSLELLFST